MSGSCAGRDRARDPAGGGQGAGAQPHDVPQVRLRPRETKHVSPSSQELVPSPPKRTFPRARPERTLPPTRPCPRTPLPPARTPPRVPSRGGGGDARRTFAAKHVARRAVARLDSSRPAGRPLTPPPPLPQCAAVPGGGGVSSRPAGRQGSGPRHLPAPSRPVVVDLLVPRPSPPSPPGARVW